MRRLFAMFICLCCMLGGARAAVCVRTDTACLLLDRAGNVIVPSGEYEDIVSLGGGWYAAQKNGLYALMDEGGALRSDHLYSDLRTAGEMLLACRDGAWGLLGPGGAQAGEFAYSKIIPTGTGTFWALKGNPDDGESDLLFLLDGTGAERETGLRILRAGKPGGALLGVQLPESGLWGWCDAEGNMAIEARFSYAGSFDCGLAPAVENGAFGAVNPQGAYVVSAEYDFLEISPFGLIIAARAAEGAWVFNMSGEQIAHYPGSEIQAAAVGGGYSVYDGEYLRIYDAKGAPLAEAPGTAAAFDGLNGRIILSDGAWGEACVYIVGTQARWQNIYPLGMAGETEVYAGMEANVTRYMNDLLGEIQVSVDMDSVRYGLTGPDGRQLLPAVYHSVEYLQDDRFLVRQDEAWQVIDCRGRVYWQLEITQTEAPSS